MIKYFQFSVTSEVIYLALAIARLNTQTLDGTYIPSTDSIFQVFQSARGHTSVEHVESTVVQPIDAGNPHAPRYRAMQNHGGLFSHFLSKPDIFNGTVINSSNQRILCWTGEPNSYSGNARFFYLEPNQVSPPEIDVDHVQDLSGQWWKVGWSTVSVNSDGAITNAKCKTSSQNRTCET